MSVAILSGGLDSTVLVTRLQQQGAVRAVLSFNYGQRHVRELDAARDACNALGLWDKHHVVDLSGELGFLLRRGSLTGDEPVPDGHYAEESMKATVVPNRNMIMLAIAAGHAMALADPEVAYAAHAGDHTIYPDCRPEFMEALDRALGLADWNPVKLHAPFARMSKADIVVEGHRIGAPMELTWSCYKGGDFHCGRCGTCVERREAFEVAGVQDLTRYEP